MAAEYITDAELLSLGGFGDALGNIAIADRNRARLAASSTVASYLRKRYGLPLSSWSDDVRRATAAIAAWDLITLRGFNPANGRDQVVASRYQDAMQWLRDVSKGLAEVEDVDDSTSYDEAGPLVSSLDPRGWGSDPDGNPRLL